MDSLHTPSETYLRGADGRVYRGSVSGWQVVPESHSTAGGPNRASRPRTYPGLKDQAATRAVIDPGDHLSARAVVDPGDQDSSRAVVDPGDHLSARAVVDPGDQDSSRAVIDPGDHLSARAVVDPGDQRIA